jgi:hypothetical protein
MSHPAEEREKLMTLFKKLQLPFITPLDHVFDVLSTCLSFSPLKAQASSSVSGSDSSLTSSSLSSTFTIIALDFLALIFCFLVDSGVIQVVVSSLFCSLLVGVFDVALEAAAAFLGTISLP